MAKTPKIIQKEVGNEDEQNDLDDMSEAHSSDEDLLQDSSSDDEKAWAKDVQLEHKKIKWEQRVKQREEAMKKGIFSSFTLRINYFILIFESLIYYVTLIFKINYLSFSYNTYLCPHYSNI